MKKLLFGLTLLLSLSAFAQNREDFNRAKKENERNDFITKSVYGTILAEIVMNKFGVKLAPKDVKFEERKGLVCSKVDSTETWYWFSCDDVTVSEEEPFYGTYGFDFYFSVPGKSCKLFLPAPYGEEKLECFDAN